jgi:PAS domain S-box-containing protein
VATLDGVYGRLIDKATTVLVSNGIKTFCVAAFMIFIFYQLVTRHLVKIAHFTQQHGVDHLDHADLVLDRGRNSLSDTDELDTVVSGVNQMRKNIAASYQLVKRSEEKYRQLVETAQEGIWTVDSNGVTTFVNPAMATMLGYTAEEMIGRHLFDFMDESGRVSANVNMQRRKDGIAEQHDFEFLCKGGERIFTTMASSPLFDKDGRYTGAIAGVLDITKRKQDELELQQHRNHLEELVHQRTCALEISNKELESFSYTVAHDLRTPLRSITSFSQLLKLDAHEKLNHDELVMLDRIVNAGKKMAALIDDVLQLSRISKTQIRLQHISVTDMAASIVDQLRLQEPSREVAVQIEAGMMIKGDPNLSYFLLQNLLQNAWKFTRKKSNAKIEIKLLEQAGAKWVHVIDNGAGYNMAYVDKLFNTFERLHLESEFEGTGVGLASVQRIVHMHGGEIRTESVEDQGARFFFTLDPVAEQDANLPLNRT